MKTGPYTGRSRENAPLRSDSYQKGRLFLPKGARIPTKNPEHTKPHPAQTIYQERHQTYKPKWSRGRRTPARRNQSTDVQTRFNTIPKRVKKITIISDSWTPLTERNRKKDLNDRGGGHKIVYEGSLVHREEQGKRPFTIRFEPKGVSIQTKRGTHKKQL